MTRKSNKQILKRAGKDMARANKSVRIPLAPFTKRSTRPTLATRTTRSSVGDTKYFSIRSLNTRPKIGEVKQTGINSSLRGRHTFTRSPLSTHATAVETTAISFGEFRQRLPSHKWVPLQYCVKLRRMRKSLSRMELGWRCFSIIRIRIRVDGELSLFLFIYTAEK